MTKKQDDFASYLFHQGTNFHSFDYMGVHFVKGSSEYVFRVWAPHAEAVFLTGDFNSWSESTPLIRVTDNGIWQVFLSGDKFTALSRYKFKVRSKYRDVFKADPYAFFCEAPPNTASVYYDIDRFRWEDSGWLTYRKETFSDGGTDCPMNLYEMHPGSWKTKENGEYLSYRELADELCPYLKQMGYTHVELMPVMEHPFDGSWGYQICGYYAPTSRYGTPDDFMYLVNALHRAGIGVILDWVPAHFPKDEHGLYEFDGEPLYEFQGEDRMEHRGWGTRKFDVGRNEVQSFLISNALFWLTKYHADGLRVDAVASMLYLDYDKLPGEWYPNSSGGRECLEAVAFFKKLTAVVKEQAPGCLLIAEESTAWANVTKPVKDGGLGFDYKWNMGWMNDMLSYAETDPLFRKFKHEKTNFSLVYAFSEQYVLPVSHDEVVHGKKSLLDKQPGDYWQKFAGTRAFLSYMMCHPGKKLLFMGCEIGQFREWDYKGSIEWFLLEFDSHKKLQSFVRDLNHFYLEHPALWENDTSWDGFQWICADNSEESVLSFRRIDKKGNELVVLINFTPTVREKFQIGVPYEGTYIELFNSDNLCYGGSGVTNAGDLSAKKVPLHNLPYRLELRLPPLGASIFVKKSE